MTISQNEAGNAVQNDKSILQVRNASVSFDMDRGQSRVLDDVDLDIYDGEIMGIVGESGSGKSMFASSLLDAVVEPGVLTGDIVYHKPGGSTIDVLSLSDAELKRLRWEEISMVFQGAMNSFNPTKTIRGHFEETLEAHRVRPEEGMDRAHELLSDLYLNPDRVLDSYPHELSGGMAQRTLIALSLVLEPNVLVMDEPTAALDLLMQRSILSLIESLQEKYDITIVFITHDLPLVAGLADRIAVMYSFEFVEVGTADEIVGNSSHPYTRSLLKAVPNLDTPLEEMRPIEGSSPDPVNVPSGCSYHPRCPMAVDQCKSEDPELYPVSDDHQSACFFWEDVDDTISLSFESSSTQIPGQERGEQSDEPLVSLEDVSVHFEETQGFVDSFLNRSNVVRAVDDVDLDIYENDVVTLVGESGCGKTTLGKTVIAAQRPTEGRISYRGSDIWAIKDGESLLPFLNRDDEKSFMDIRRALQVIHQDPGSSLNPNRKIKAILSVPLKRWRSDLGMRERQRLIYSMFEQVGLSPADDYAGRYPHQLSGGEKQRVALVRALLMNPDLILADEAVSALDVSLRIEMMDLMLDLQDTFDTSYVFISHNLSNARYFSGKAGGRIAVMYLGEIVEIGPAEEMINDPRHPYTKVLKWASADLDADQTIEEPPIREIDIPDPVDPPSGCRFHTRCPEAREICVEQAPSLESTDEIHDSHQTACFRDYGDDHPYWESEPLANHDQ